LENSISLSHYSHFDLQIPFFKAAFSEQQTAAFCGEIYYYFRGQSIIMASVKASKDLHYLHS